MHISTAGVETTAVAVDAATGDESKREGELADGDGGNDAHEAEDDDGDKVTEKERLEGSERGNDGRVELRGMKRGHANHELGIHRRGKQTVLVGQRLAKRAFK